MGEKIFRYLFIFNCFVFLISFAMYLMTKRKNSHAQNNLGIIWCLWSSRYNNFSREGYMGWFAYLLAFSFCLLLLHIGKVKELVPVLIFWSYGFFTTIPLRIIFGEKGVLVEEKLIYFSEIDGWSIFKDAGVFHIRLRVRNNQREHAIPVPDGELERIKMLLCRNVKENAWTKRSPMTRIPAFPVAG